jgi:hypothetical protein
VGDESWVQQQSSLYALAQRQLADAGQQLDARQKQLAGLQHEKDELLRHFEAKQMKEEVGGWVATCCAQTCYNMCVATEIASTP